MKNCFAVPLARTWNSWTERQRDVAWSKSCQCFVFVTLTAALFASGMQAMDHAAGQHPDLPERSKAPTLQNEFRIYMHHPSCPHLPTSARYGLPSKAFAAKVGGAPLASA